MTYYAFLFFDFSFALKAKNLVDELTPQGFSKILRG